MKRRQPCWYEDLRSFSGTTDTPIKNNKERRSANTKSNLECHKCGSTDHFIKDCPMRKNEKGKGKARKTGRLPTKGNFNKTDFRKAMIVAWGESESDAETKKPKEEETTNLVSWLHTKARMRSLKEKR